MPQFVTIEEINDRKNWASVVFEDTLLLKIYRDTVDLPEEDFINEAALLDYVAGFWPYDFFAATPRPRPQDKHLVAKTIKQDQKNISGRVAAGTP